MSLKRGSDGTPKKPATTPLNLLKSPHKPSSTPTAPPQHGTPSYSDRYGTPTSHGTPTVHGTPTGYVTPTGGTPRQRTDAKRVKVDPETQLLVKLVSSSVRRAKSLFINNYGAGVEPDAEIKEMKASVKRRHDYFVEEDGAAQPLINEQTVGKQGDVKLLEGPKKDVTAALPKPTGEGQLIVAGDQQKAEELKRQTEKEARRKDALQVLPMSGKELRAMHDKRQAKPTWHAPWKLHKVIPGHLGVVRTVAVDWTNEWFASSGADRTVKIWDLASGKLRITLTGHISTVRGLAISSRSPYLFTCGEDGKVLCWDLEQNKVVRHYHGHLNGVYSLALHPTLDILVSGGRDASVRVWDIRTKSQVHCMTGHQGAIASLACQAAEPQIISGSHDTMIRQWDIVAGKTMATLTNHKKSVRALAIHPSEYCYLSGAPDNLKKWRCPKGEFLMNFSGHNTTVNSVAINHENVVVSGGDNGTLFFWDWKTGYNFQQMETIAQPGSLEAENSILCTTFDHSGSRLITGEGDKSIKIWKEDETATPETHPINWKPERAKHF